MENDDDAKKIIGYLDIIKDLEVEENDKFYDSKDIEYLNEYDSLNTIKLIKSNPEYSLSKWEIIFNNLINFNDFIFHLKDKNDLLEKERIFLLNKKNMKKNKNKNISSSSFNENQSIQKNSSSSNYYSSGIEYKNKYSSSCNDTNNSGLSLTKKELYEFKLYYMKKYLNFEENEKMDGESFKKYAKKTFYTMLLLLKIDYYLIFNPKNILFEQIKEVLQEKQKFKFPEINAESFEIDVVINKFVKSDFEQLLNKFPNHFFFIDQLRLKEIKDHEFNLFSEISRDLVYQAQDKYNKEKKYISIFNFLDEIKSESLKDNIEGKYESIINSISIKDAYKENVFIFMTDGSYFLLKFIVNIISDIFKQNLNKDESAVKDLINNKIKEFHTTSIENIIKNNKKEKIVDIVYQFYLIFYELRIQKIKHCLFYIGEDSGNKYENNLSKYMTFINYNKKNYLEKEQKKFWNDFTINNKIKDKIKDLFDIQNNFRKILENFGLNFYKELCKKENENEKNIYNAFSKISLDKNLISLLFLINKDTIKNGQEYLKPLKETKKFDIKLEYFEKEFDLEQIKNLKKKYMI